MCRKHDETPADSNLVSNRTLAGVFDNAATTANVQADFQQLLIQLTVSVVALDKAGS